MNRLSAHYDCFQAAVSLLCLKYERKPEWLFLTCFGIEYFTDEENFFNRLNPRISIEDNVFFKLVYGIEMKAIRNTVDRDVLLQLKVALREGYDVIVLMDAFDCPWNPAYQKKHFFHYFLIYNFDEERVFVCRDPYVSEKYYKISEKLLQKGILEFYYLKVKEDCANLKETDFSSLALRGYSKEIICMRYGQLMEDLLKIEELEGMFEDTDPNLCRIILSTKQIGKYCRGFHSLLLLLYEEMSVSRENMQVCTQKYLKECLQETAELADAMALEWEMVNAVLLKMLFRGAINKRSIYAMEEYLEKIRNYELAIYEKIDSLK